MLGNYLALGDCYDLIKLIPDKSVDLIITDPPYEIDGCGKGAFGTRNYYKEYSKLGKDKHKNLNAKSKASKLNNNCSGFDYTLLDEFDRVLKKINIYIWCNKNQISSLMKHYEDMGCNVDLLCWCKTNPIPTCNNKYLSNIEYCVFVREKSVKVYGNYNTLSKYYVTPLNVKDKKLYHHPTIKPLNIIKNFISNSCQGGDLVLDPFAGSGTTLIGARELNRRFIGFEIDKKFYEIALKRIKGEL